MGSRRKNLLRSVLVLAGIVILIRLLAAPIASGYANWLVVTDPFEHADAAVTLAGGEGERLAASIQLFKARKVDHILIVGPDAPYLQVYTGEDSLSQGEAKRRIAVKKGVPDSLIVLSLGATSTYEEAQSTLRKARDQNWRSIVVVTSPMHTRRARATFRKAFEGAGVDVWVHHLPIGRSSQNPDHWWEREHETMAVLTETIKLVFYGYRYRISPWS